MATRFVRVDLSDSARDFAPIAVEPGESDAEVTQRIATGLEAAIRRNPEWWYPFGEIYER